MKKVLIIIISIIIGCPLLLFLLWAIGLALLPMLLGD